MSDNDYCKKLMSTIEVIKERPYKLKLTSTDRRHLKKRFGQKGYERFCWLNQTGMLDFMDPNKPYDALPYVWVEKRCLSVNEDE